MGLKIYHIFWSYLRKHSSTFLVLWVRPIPLYFMIDEGEGTPDQSISKNLSLGVIVHSSSYWFLCHSAILQLEARTFHLGHAVIHRHWLEGGKKVLLWWKQSFPIGQSCQRYSNADIKLWQHLKESETVEVRCRSKHCTVLLQCEKLEFTFVKSIPPIF